MTLPRMGGTDANTVSITGGNFPIRRNVNRLLAILNKREIVDFARMKRRVNVEAIALQGGGEKKSVRARMRVHEHRRKITSE